MVTAMLDGSSAYVTRRDRGGQVGVAMADGPNDDFAIQTRINMETLAADGTVRPAGGTLRSYDAPSGPGVRTDGFGYAGYKTKLPGSRSNSVLRSAPMKPHSIGFSRLPSTPLGTKL